MRRVVPIVGYGFGTAAFRLTAAATAWPMLSGQREFGSGGPLWIPAAMRAVVALICAIGLYQTLADCNRRGDRD